MISVFKEPACRALFLIIALGSQSACAGSSSQATPVVTPVTQSATAIAPPTSSVPAGSFILGSDEQEREYGYQLDEAAYGHSRTRTSKWYDSERNRAQASTPAYEITTSPVTNAQYLAFVQATNHPAPEVDRTTWNNYGLIHPYNRTRRHAWQDQTPPSGRDNHPVVMVSYDDAVAYAEWLSSSRNEEWRLPTESEWEKAVRGTQGAYFPWGNTFENTSLNSHDTGPFDTVPVGERSPPGPFGLVDGAGQVFEWVLTPNANRAWVKGGSWDDSGCGVCRSAARHSRPKDIKHILIGFRLIKVL